MSISLLLSSEIIRINQAEAADVVVVGGGPVGLWTAIQTKILTGKKIVVIEKYIEYQRADIRLNIASSSFKGIPNDKGLKALIQQWKGKLVPIKEMEEALTKRAHELGIIILKGYQAEPQQLPQQFPSAQLFIGADGARSKVKKEIFNDSFRFNSTHQYIAQVQYIVKKNEAESFVKTKIDDFSKNYQIQKFAEHFIVQTIRPQEEDTFRVTLQIFIDKPTYDQMSDATFGKPYYFETDLQRVPDSLRKVLIKWWGACEQFNSHQIQAEVGQLNKVTVIALGSYAAEDVIKKDSNNRLWALVGDAAAAFPFFRAINNGLLLGTKLAQCAAEAFQKQNQPIEKRDSFISSFRSYSRYTTTRVYIERIRAFIKNILIEFSKVWLKLSNRVPWQSIKLTEERKKEIYNKGAETWKKLSGIPAPVYKSPQIFLSFSKMTSPVNTEN